METLLKIMPLAVFLILGIPFFWVTFLCIKLGRLLNEREAFRDFPPSQKGFWPELFKRVPEARVRVREIVYWLVAMFILAVLGAGLFLFFINRH